MEHIHAFVADVCSTNSLSMVKGDAARIAVAIGGIRDPSAVLDVARPMVERRREAGRVLRQAMADAGLPGGAEAEIQAITKDYGNREPPTADNAATIVSAIIARLKGRREAVERIALLRPLADEAKLILPDSALEASGIGELMASGGWESALAALRAEHDGAVRSRLGAQGVNSFSDLASMANNGNARAVGLVMLGAAGFKGEIQQAADIVARGLGAGDAESQEFAAAIGALGARIRANAEAADRASRERQAAMRWRSSLLTPAGVCSRLEASLAEVQRWIGDGRLPVAARDHVGSGGQELTLHDPAHVRLAKGEVQAWRAEWADGLRARRREAAQRDDAVLRRRRLAVVRSAVPGAAMSGDHVLAPLGPLGSDICGAPATVELGGTSPVRLPWPGNMAVADGQGEALRGGARKEAVQALRKEIGAVVGAVRAELGEVLHNWNHQATAVMREYPVEEQPEFASRLRHALRTAASATGCSPSLPDAVTRMLARALSAAVTQHAKEQKHGSLRRASGLSDYAALFPEARAIRRRLILHVGPTNSGKTHDAMERLAAAVTGCYLAPLRLMAIEAAERLNGRGVPTDMVTGEERILADGARHVASTVEMADLDRPVGVAVIDEIQMLADRDRGWAWTQAAVGVAAAEVVMTGSIDALPHVVRIAEMTGDELEVITYERKVPLEAVREPVALREIGEGDAVVVFSRGEVLRLRAVLGQRLPVAVIYGSLSPEVRRNEARRFRDGEAKVLIATDAISLGLNLPARRVVFGALRKFDGVSERGLTDSEIRQIAGRAGRFGIAERGEAAVLDGLSSATVAKALSGRPEPSGDDRLHVMPPWRAVEAVARSLNTVKLVPILQHISASLLRNDPLLLPASLEDALGTASIVEGSGLPLRTRLSYLGCPVDRRGPGLDDIRRWSQMHAKGTPVGPPACGADGVPETDGELAGCEEAVKRLTTYMWLAMRWPEAYPGYAQADSERGRLNGLIEAALTRKALARTCRECGGRMPADHPFGICDRCHRSRCGRWHDHDGDYDDDPEDYDDDLD